MTSALVVTNGRMVTDNPADGEPAWAPDGARIVFSRAGEIMVIDYPGGSPVNITNHPAADRTPAWSPDGSRMAFASDRDGQPELYLMNPDGSGVVRVTNGVGFAGQPAWSPDGARLAFTCVIEGSYSDICVVNPDGTGFVRLTTHPATDSGPAWSPDGTRIAFATARYSADPSWFFGIDLQLVVMNSDGTGVTPVGAMGTAGFHPSWSPNGARIVFVRMDPCDFMICGNVYVINADGTDEAWVAEGWDPAWRPPVDPPAPEVLLSPASLNFGDRAVGTSISAPVSLINTGNADLAFSGIAVSGEFAQTNTCGGSVAAGAGCTITVTFAPTATGPHGGAMTITDNAAGSPRVVPLSGSGILPAPRVAISPASLIFGNQLLGTTGEAHILSVVNTGSADLVIFAIAVTGDFAQTNTCGSSIAAGGGCTISVTFTPTVTGLRNGTLTIVHNAAGSPREVALSGLGNTPPVASFTFACSGLTCSFDAAGSSDPSGTIAAYTWIFGDGAAGSGVVVSHTYAAVGTYPVVLTVADGDGATGVQSQNVSLPTIHVGDLDRAGTSQGGGWTATVTITVHDGGHAPVANAVVTGAWTGWGTGSCTTSGSGQCAVSRSGIPKKTGSVTFTVVNVTGPGRTYASAANHDPDRESNETSITVNRP